MGNMYRRNKNKIPAYTVSSSIPTNYETVMIKNEEKKGFSSQTKRFPSYVCLNENPGPGSYGCISSAEVKSPSFSKKGTTGFVPSKVKKLPGVTVTHREASQDPMHTAYRVPLLTGYYEVNDCFIQHGSKSVSSPFKSKTQRIPVPMNNHVPGPGAYTPHRTPTPVKRTILPRGYYLAISAPPLIVPKDPPLPGPGQYDVVNYNSPSKHPMPTAAFASRTERIPLNPRTDTNPGPGFYDPQILSKQSFFYSDSKVWIPV
uniref:O(6)-methylguanine-induced apoptosis 2 isoform X3 n=1 Tax=Monopterus albus TaxID=43700 RepID=UPI0009B394F6|nr:O(6)-methylguanine-induced apoptosis 2 isoform X3 [Monopterus albus]